MSAPIFFIVPQLREIVVATPGPQGPPGAAASPEPNPVFDSITLRGPGDSKFKLSIVGILPSGAPDMQWEPIE